MLVASWIVYGIVYAGFAMSESFAALTSWLLVYGVHFALAEGTEKAMVADLAPASLRGTAFGIFHGIVGFGSLAASVVFGIGVEDMWGAPAAFGLGAALALAASVLLHHCRATGAVNPEPRAPGPAVRPIRPGAVAARVSQGPGPTSAAVRAASDLAQVRTAA